MDYISYQSYYHSSADTEPIRTTAADGTPLNVVGVELEIGEVYDAAGLDALIEAGTIEAEDTAWAPVVIEREAQSGVQYELIFRADTPGAVLERVEEISAEIRSDIYCHRQTSCHVHANRDYIHDVLDISEEEFNRAAESIAPFIYEISGRDLEAWNEWTPSRLSLGLSRWDRFQELDAVEPKYGGRYALCNVQNENTLEIRGFSNYCEFNPALIGVYIGVVSDLIPTIAQEMKGKSYAQDGLKTVLPLVEDFINRAGDALNGFQLDSWKNSKQELRKVSRQQVERAYSKYQDVMNWSDRARNCTNSTDAADYVLRMLRLDKDLKLPAINLEDISETLDDIETQALKLLKNRTWRA